jgi:protease I
MAKKLQKKRVAILVTDGFKQDELGKPRQALDEAGALTEIVSPKANKVKGWKYTDWGEDFRVDCQKQLKSIALSSLSQTSPANRRV